jgi:hypothetical protein
MNSKSRKTNYQPGRIEKIRAVISGFNPPCSRIVNQRLLNLARERKEGTSVSR